MQNMLPINLDDSTILHMERIVTYKIISKGQ